MLCQVSLKQFLSILSKNNSQGVGRISNLKQTKRLIKQKKKKRRRRKWGEGHAFETEEKPTEKRTN